MKTTALTFAACVAIAALSAPAIAGDAALGKQKAAACVVCHGNETFGGMFYTLQLAGRDADKLTVKTLKYKTGKIIHPIMNVSTALFSEKDIEDIAAYYKSLGKPAFTSPYFKIQGDEQNQAAPAVSPAAPNAAGSKVAGAY